MTDTFLRKIARTLKARRFSHTDEDELQRAIAEVFTQDGIEHEREAWLGATDRVDFLCGAIAVEVKTKGALADVGRQLARYSKHDRVEAIVLVTTRRQLAPLSSTPINGKPCWVVWIGSGL